MLVLSVTPLSPLLALTSIILSPIPIQTGLFDVHVEPPSAVLHAPSLVEILTGLGRTLVYWPEMNFPLPSSNLLPCGILVEPGRYLLIGGITLVFQDEIFVLIIVPMPTWGGLGKERKSGVNRALVNKIINTQRCLVTEYGLGR